MKLSTVKKNYIFFLLLFMIFFREGTSQTVNAIPEEVIAAIRTGDANKLSPWFNSSVQLIILEKEMQEFSDELIVMTDDGSYGKKGLVTQGMEEVIQREKVDISVVIGPAIMMKFASLTTKKYNIKTYASLNTIMVDGTGMCGACRVTVGGKTRFVCIDGPEFDAHEVDFDEMIQRLGAFKEQEQEAFERYQKTVS